MKSVIHLLLCLSLLLTAFASTVRAAEMLARGPGVEMVICGADGPRQVVVDAAGQPMAPDALCDCSKCLVQAVFLLPDAQVPRGSPTLHRHILTWLTDRCAPPRPLAPPLARGPPALPGTACGLLPHHPDFRAQLDFCQTDLCGCAAEPGQFHEEAR